MIVKTAIYVQNLSPRVLRRLLSLTREDIEFVTKFKLDASEFRTQVCDDLVTFNVLVDETQPSYEGEAFAKEDFLSALLETVNDPYEQTEK